MVRLPPSLVGAKLALDDFLVRDGAVAFRRLLESPPAAPADPQVDPAQFTVGGYAVMHGQTHHFTRTRDTDSDQLLVKKKTKLANFVARIVGETVNDDGVEQTRAFTVAVEQRDRPPRTADVPVERFGSLNWVVEGFGSGCIIQAGFGTRDHLRCAIQEMSGQDIPAATVFRYTGWRQMNDQWVYLHGKGAIVPLVPSVPVSEGGGGENAFVQSSTGNPRPESDEEVFTP